MAIQKSAGGSVLRYVLIGVLLLCLAACAQPGGTTGKAISPAELKAQIDANNAAWSVALNQGDTAAVAALYTENATILPPGANIQRGRAAIEKTVQGLVSSGARNMVLTATDVSQVGPDTAREIGRFSLQAPGPKKKLVTVEGKYLVIWKQVGGKWLLDVDIWNTNK
jgi:uncharacterized protein (TIGR02246 family)